MALLADYAITPDVFDVMSYQNEGECEARLELIREPLLTEGLVRDIRDGEWRRFIENPARAWHRRGKELIRKLATQGRLVQFSSALPHPPLMIRVGARRHWTPTEFENSQAGSS